MNIAASLLPLRYAMVDDSFIAYEYNPTKEYRNDCWKHLCEKANLFDNWGNTNDTIKIINNLIKVNDTVRVKSEAWIECIKKLPIPPDDMIDFNFDIYGQQQCAREISEFISVVHKYHKKD